MHYLASPPVLRRGTIQALPCRGPHGRGCELSRIRTAATMSLSATGSRKAPKAEIRFCKHGEISSAMQETQLSAQVHTEFWACCRQTQKHLLGINAHHPYTLHP